MSTLADKRLIQAKLSESGLPLFEDFEVECMVIDSVSVEFEDGNGFVVEKDSLRHGIGSLTTHRFIWIDEAFYGSVNKKRCYALPLSSVISVETVKWNISRLMASPRLRIKILSDSSGNLIRILNSDPNPSTNSSQSTVTLVFRGQTSCSPFIQKFEDTLKKKNWISNNYLKSGLQKPSASVFSPRNAGISGILAIQENQLLETDKNLNQAFTDLNALMTKAQEMVQLAERMRTKLLSSSTNQLKDSNSDSNSNSNSNDEFGGSSQEMQDWLLSVGIASPVTRDSAGALYHQQLAKQLADFIKLPLEKAGGMVAVVDAYCIFNRARGTELISPEDLVKACSIWESIDVPVMLRRFDSGVLVIQSKSHNDDQFISQLQKVVFVDDGYGVGISASDAAKALGISPSLAKEELCIAENKGMLCRDDGPDGLKFFKNFFKEIECV